MKTFTLHPFTLSPFHLFTLSLALLAGCWTLSETPMPQVVAQKLPLTREIKVQLSGFDATVTSYSAIYGYETVMGHDWYGHHHYYGPMTVATTAYVPQVAADRTYLNRATETLERSGYILQTTAPDYRIDVQFVGPFVADGENMKNVCWNIFTLFTADRVAKIWQAKLKIYDLKTGKLVFDREYAQDYEVLVWGPIPFFSPLGSEKTDFYVVQSVLLTALTDRTIAEATDFLSGYTPTNHQLGQRTSPSVENSATNNQPPATNH